METIALKFDLTSTDTDVSLGFCAKINDKTFAEIDHVKETQTIESLIDLEDGEHLLKFILFNKSIAHTTVDKNNIIVKDARLIIKNFQINDQPLDQVLYTHSTYYHDFNGTGDSTKDKFYGELGCNGCVELYFDIPSYIWFLQVCD